MPNRREERRIWWRIPVGVIVNVVPIVAIGTLGFIVLRLSWPEYLAVEKAMTFTTGMMAARLDIAATAARSSEG